MPKKKSNFEKFWDTLNKPGLATLMSIEELKDWSSTVWREASRSCLDELSKLNETLDAAPPACKHDGEHDIKNGVDICLSCGAIL